MKIRLFAGAFIGSMLLVSAAMSRSQANDAISKATNLIKEYMAGSQKRIITVTIIDNHNGRHAITSTLRSEADTIHILTQTNAKRDTAFSLSREMFIFKLNNASYPVNSPPSYNETISVMNNGAENTFETSHASTLRLLLTYGR